MGDAHSDWRSVFGALLFFDATRSGPSDRAPVIARADAAFAPLCPEGARVTPLRARKMHFVDAPDRVAVEADTRVWSWWTEDADPSAWLDLTCKLPDPDGGDPHELFVARRARWEALSVECEGRRVALPLDGEYLVMKCYADDGAARGMRLDGSALTLFAWRLTGEGCEPLAELDDGDGVRVFAAVELVCARPRRGVDPWGLALGAPVHPRLSVWATGALGRIEATLVLDRTESTVMVGCEADVEARYRGRADSALGATWVRFASDTPTREALGWDGLFDHVRRGDGAALAVDPSAVAGAREGAWWRRALDVGRIPAGAEAAPSDAWRFERPQVARVGRQGEVDGVVIAPTLRAPEALRGAMKWWRLDAIEALPLSAHDALHVVWRWPGEAPGVSEAQRVTVAVEGASMRYTAERATPLPPRTWETLFAHGAFFGLSLDAQGWNDALLDGAWRLPEALAAHRDAPWLRHWIGRYCVAGAQGPTERVVVA